MLKWKLFSIKSKPPFLSQAPIKYLILAFALASFLAGTIFFAYKQGWIIFCFPAHETEITQTIENMKAGKKRVTLFFWNNNRWNKETVEILETEDRAQTIQHLINSWLTLLDEAQLTTKKVTLQSALLSENNQVYLSFDRNPFDETSSTYKKWMWIEGLLKTIRENGMQIQSIQFLVHHQPMQDYHLDFSNPWPVSGFG